MLPSRALRERFHASSVVAALLVLATVGLPPVLAHRAEAGPVLLGLYSQVERNPRNIKVLRDVDAWLAPTGKRIAMAGLYISMDDVVQSVPPVVNTVWNNGYVPFVNLMTGSSTAAIARGDQDAAIRNLARHFARWAGNGQRRAFLAPLPEMNGYWWTYHGPPETFKQAFRRIRQIFEEELVSRGASLSAVSWVFAPNGWSRPGDEFEKYYPGADLIDIVSVTGFNFGGCPGPTAVWDTFDTALKPYLDRAAAMAAGKPIFVAETGTVEVQAQGKGDKNQWLQELFTRLAAYPRFRGLVYNLTEIRKTLPACPQGADYRLHVPGTNLWPGVLTAMAALPNYVYWAPASPQMTKIVFGRQPAQIFADVPTMHPLALEDGDTDVAPSIHAAYAAKVIGACATAPLRYCPGSSVTREQMAVLLLRGMRGSGATPPPATGVFPDVPPTHPSAAWIEALAAEGITSGCGGGQYCPGKAVTRGEMVAFLLRSMRGRAYMPPSGTGTRFADVPPSHPLVAWIEQLAADGVADGCGGRNFCPEAPVTRAQMAVLLVRAFNLAR
jgi:hypothetical protein